MDNLIIQTKFALPQPPVNYLPRPRLDTLWQTWSGKRLVLITAGAGFGKTSLIVGHAHALPRPCAWYALDELDAELSGFTAHLLRTVILITDSETAALPDTPLPPEQVLAEVVRRLRSLESGCLLVLDDVHLVAASTAVLGFIERLIRFLPEQVTLVLSSREHLDIATMRLRTQGAVATLEAKELAFDHDELAEFIAHRFPTVDFSPSHLRRIASLTEGWAAGLEIFCQVLGDTSVSRIDEALAEIQSGGTGWFLYFAEEVLESLDETTRDFLLRSSVLPRLDADLCDNVLGITGSARILKGLLRRNLFTFIAADGGYRYHHLFRDFLREQLERTCSATRLTKLRRSAAKALAGKSSWVEAITAYAAAGDSAAILRLLEKLGDDLLLTGQYTILNSALNSLPAAVINGSVPALHVLGQIHDIQGRWAVAERSYRKALRICKKGSRRIELLTLLAQNKIRQGHYRPGLKLCNQALAEPGRLSSSARAHILGLQGIASADLGRIDESETCFKQAAAIFHRKQDSPDEARTLYLLAANVYFPRGDFRQAKSTARRSVVIYRKLKDSRRICHSLGVLGWVMVAGGDLREGRDITEEALRLAEGLDYHTMLGVCRYTLGLFSLYTGDLTTAEEYFESIRELGEQLGEAELQSIPYIGLAAVALAGGNRHAGRKYAKRALAIVQETQDVKTEAQCNVLLGQAAVQTSRKRANEYWDRAESLFTRFGGVFDLNRLRLIRLDRGRSDDAGRREMLTELLVGIAENNHEQLFMVFEPAAAARTLAEALRLGIEIDYVTDLLVRLGEGVVPELAAVVRIAADSESASGLRLRVIDILARIGGETARRALAELASDPAAAGDSAERAAEELNQVPSVPLHITALGPLVVQVGERVLDFNAWRSKRALRLFQLLLVHRFKWVPQDMVLEALWPGSDPSKARNNLRQSVFLLRKVLEPEKSEVRISRYVQQRNEAYRLEAGAGFTYDVLQFEEALAEADKHLNAGRHQEAGERLQVAVDLYRGDFLAESPYEEVAVFEREQLRHELLRGVLRLIDLHAQADRWEVLVPLCRRGLALDIYNEKLHRHLVHAQYRLGNRREALADFHRYEEMMMSELDLLPSAGMRALADKVMTMGSK
ncbi:MAG: tetratricopeptide repeat protein [bacterium]|nr:tetratricopeptide repeat protein [bacterium]